MATEERDVCTKGKSCKTTCIKSNLVCRESVSTEVQSGLSRLVEMLTSSVRRMMPKPPPPKSPALQTIERGKEFLREYEERRNKLDRAISGLRKENLAIEASIFGRSRPRDIQSLRSRLSKNLAEINRNEQELVKVMADIRLKMLSSSSTSKEKIDKILKDVYIGKGSSKDQQAVREQLAEFIRMFGGKGFANVKESPQDSFPLTNVVISRSRPWANPENGITSLDGKPGNTFHEIGHFIEVQRPWLKQFAQQWRDGRAWDRATVKEMYGMEDTPPPIVGERRSGNRRIPILPLSYLAGGSYRQGEVAVADEFLHPYMGKLYSDGKSTEVISMAIEQFSSPHRMATLSRSHPDLFNLIVGLSRD